MSPSRRCRVPRRLLVFLAATTAAVSQTRAGAQLPDGFVDELYVQGLKAASTLSVSPDGRIFAAERLAGRVRIIRDGELLREPYFVFDDLFVPGTIDLSGSAPPNASYQGGLLGIAFAPDYPKTHALYAFYTATDSGSRGVDRIVELTGLERGTRTATVLDGIPAAIEHHSGRLELGIDGNLFVSVGDTGNGPLAQDPAVLAGKILRIGRDGNAPSDNPFVENNGYRPEIFALGVRNAFGLAVDPVTGRLYESENGTNENDEVNLISSGSNLGYPLCSGPCQREGFTDPIFSWQDVIAPTGAVYYDGDAFPEEYRRSLYVASWLYGRIYRLKMSSDGTRVLEAALFHVAAGPIYDLRMGRDGALYYLTSDVPLEGGRTVRRIRYLAGGQPLLSHSGNSRPEEFVSISIIGTPGATAEHLYSFERLAVPLDTLEGLLWLSEPVTTFLGRIGADGQLTITFPLPSWTAGTTIYHQGRVTLNGASTLTPLVEERVYPSVAAPN